MNTYLIHTWSGNVTRVKGVAILFNYIRRDPKTWIVMVGGDERRVLSIKPEFDEYSHHCAS